MLLRFDLYGRQQIAIRREGDGWRAYRPGNGTLVPMAELPIPAGLAAAELAIYLDDIFHEMGEPGREVRLLA
ncbi:hypothetical protein [Chitinimonas sp.]|uniref:DUF7661 family protein n=1 Tax=Chitinimonas sp. TaxID=1934313 RepID=UPI0035B38017